MAQTILTRAELEAHDPEGGKNGRWLCPLVNGICEHKTDPRRHRSLSLDNTSGLWNCKRCGERGQLREKWKPIEPRRPWEDRKAEARRVRERRRQAALAIVKRPPLEDSTAAFSAFRLGSLRVLAGSPGAAYLAGRGIGPELLRGAGVRFAPDYGRRPAEGDRPAWSGAPAVVFPIRSQGGKLVAAQGRFIAPRGDGPKMLTFGPKSSGVFATPGALDTPGPVAVVEAPIDALSLAAAGLPAVALCGTSGAPAWLLDLLAWRLVLLAFDADEPKDGKPGAGDRAAEAFAEELVKVSMGRAKVSRLRPEGAKDWNQLLTDRGLEAIRAQVAPVLMASQRPIGGQITPPIAQTALLEPPDAKQGVSEPVMEAPPAAEDLIGAEERQEQERTEALLLDAWRALVAGRLPIEPFELGHGHRCTRPDRWLLSAVKRRARLLRELGPDWWDTDAGQGLAVDLRAFADWYGSTDRREGTEGQPAPAPAPGRV